MDIYFYILHYVILNFIILIWDENLQFYMKMSSCLFLLFSMFICTSIIVSMVILSYPQFYHTYVRRKSTILIENVSTSFSDYILIVFVCLPLYLWKLPQKSSIFKFFLWISLTLSEICYTKSSVLSENISNSFSIMRYFYLYVYKCIWAFSKKVFNFFSYHM